MIVQSCIRAYVCVVYLICLLLLLRVDPALRLADHSAHTSRWGGVDHTSNLHDNKGEGGEEATSESTGRTVWVDCAVSCHTMGGLTRDQTNENSTKDVGKEIDKGNI